MNDCQPHTSSRSRFAHFSAINLNFCFALGALIALCALLIATPSLRAQRNALTLPRNLAELVDESDVIVQGRVIGVSLERHRELSNLVMVQVVIRVESALKGKTGATYTMRQAVLDPRDQQEKLGYRVGEHVLLILVKPNQYGLSSPAGLDQGRFRIQTGPDGNLQALNRWANAGLFRELTAQMLNKGVSLPSESQAMIARSRPGPVPLEPLKTLIRSLAAEK